MTVENMLERTVVRAAAPGGGAEAAGVETGSLLVALDGQTTKVASQPASPLFCFCVSAAVNNCTGKRSCESKLHRVCWQV